MSVRPRFRQCGSSRSRTGANNSRDHGIDAAREIVAFIDSVARPLRLLANLDQALGRGGPSWRADRAPWRLWRRMVAVSTSGVQGSRKEVSNITTCNMGSATNGRRDTFRSGLSVGGDVVLRRLRRRGSEASPIPVQILHHPRVDARSLSGCSYGAARRHAPPRYSLRYARRLSRRRGVAALTLVGRCWTGAGSVRYRSELGKVSRSCAGCGHPR
jgi:hypothetical protein